MQRMFSCNIRIGGWLEYEWIDLFLDFSDAVEIVMIKEPKRVGSFTSDDVDVVVTCNSKKKFNSC